MEPISGREKKPNTNILDKERLKWEQKIIIKWKTQENQTTRVTHSECDTES